MKNQHKNFTDIQELKCQRLFRPKISKVKTRDVAHIQ